MSGNVWEWTSSQWGKRVNEPDFTYGRWEEPKQKAQRDDLEAHALRIIRGGSWDSQAGYARCACRGGSLPNSRDYVLGFRLVLGGVLPGAF